MRERRRRELDAIGEPGDHSVERVALTGWRMTLPARHETLRWESPEGRWVSITVADLGASCVRAFDGRCEVLPTFDDALEAAAQLRR